LIFLKNCIIIVEEKGEVVKTAGLSRPSGNINTEKWAYHF